MCRKFGRRQPSSAAKDTKFQSMGEKSYRGLFDHRVHAKKINDSFKPDHNEATLKTLKDRALDSKT
jgi:hypothetical protein